MQNARSPMQFGLYLQAQNTEIVLLVVKNDAFNQAGEAVEFGGGIRHGRVWSGGLLNRCVLD